MSSICCRRIEVLAGKLVRREQIEDDGAALEQVAYGWADANARARLRDT
jgi:hypothetical protein